MYQLRFRLFLINILKIGNISLFYFSFTKFKFELLKHNKDTSISNFFYINIIIIYIFYFCLPSKRLLLTN